VGRSTAAYIEEGEDRESVCVQQRETDRQTDRAIKPTNQSEQRSGLVHRAGGGVRVRAAQPTNQPSVHFVPEV